VPRPLTRPPPARSGRDLATGTALAQYKANNSNPGCFCTLGSDYFAAAQASKDAVHVYAFHKVRRPAAAAAAASAPPPPRTRRAATERSAS
jgi:hypothetical protein